MSYHRRKTKAARARVRAGGLLGFFGLGDTEPSATATLAAASSDPYLPEVICRAGQLRALEDKTIVPTCPKTAMNKTGGIGMRKAIYPLRAYVYAEQHRWVYGVAAFGIIGLPILIGYSIGKGH